jgi:hypothetical protein
MERAVEERPEEGNFEGDGDEAERRAHVRFEEDGLWRMESRWGARDRNIKQRADLGRHAWRMRSATVGRKEVGFGRSSGSLASLE